MSSPYRELKERAWAANQEIPRRGLAIYTFGNVSALDADRGVIAIKPSGVPYDELKIDDLVVVDLEGKVVEGTLRASSDTPTHLVLYRNWKGVGGIVHTHSLFATAWAQAKHPIPAFGTTHADYWHGEVPCTRLMTSAEINSEYEANTGVVIVETFANVDPLHRPGAVVASHGPFAWGRDAGDAVHNAVILEYLARLASETLRIQPATDSMQPALLDKHFLRKHGPKAYYGQK